MITENAPAAPGGRIVAIQLLRAVAALAVAAAHLAFGFADMIGTGLALGTDWRGEREAQGAVMLFFIVSGYVMVEASQGRFGTPGARGQFWRRRLIRIMPPYWIASGVLAAVLVVALGKTVDPGHVLRSLALVPQWPGRGELRASLFLWVGWTLIYEMAFYLLFGLFLSWPRRQAIIGVTAVLAAAIVAGTWVPPVDPLIFALTRPLPVMFVVGMGLALWRGRGGALSPLWRWLALAAVIPAVLAVPAPLAPTAAGWDYLAWAGIPALLIALAVLGGTLTLPQPHWINRAGDASYALYLLHLPAGWLCFRLVEYGAGPWSYLAVAMIVSLAVSWLFFRWIEQPMTAALNRRFAPPHKAHG